MYNNIYENYINYMIGVTNRSQYNLKSTENKNMDLEQFYPEVYKFIYPMVKTACMRNTKTITKETIDEMVNDIYFSFNADDVNSSETRNNKMEEVSKKANNVVLNDLIRILLIRELL